jgi:glycosyltransferase involved in cell wall biosynthesis
MIRALGELGHEVSLVTVNEPSAEAVAGLPLRLRERLPERNGASHGDPLPLSWSQEKFRSYWGIDGSRIRAVARAAKSVEADAVVVVGLNVLPYLGAVQGRLRVWYAADEWFFHHLSQVRLLTPSTWGDLRLGVTKGLYERAYRSLLDRVWVVTETDRTAMRWVAGARQVDVIPNGIDGEYYRPVDAPQTERSCTFWGRLDFGPNVQALQWFCGRVWPLVRRQAPDARFTIYGFQPTPPVQALVGRDGVELIPDLPDLRPEVARHQVVVLPFVSGGGIKNKLLEAASQAKAIICSPAACGGLRLKGEPPFARAQTPGEWATRLTVLWQDGEARRRLGESARGWVLEHHSWRAAATQAADGLLESLEKTKP